MIEKIISFKNLFTMDVIELSMIVNNCSMVLCYMNSTIKSSERNHIAIIERKYLHFLDLPSSRIMGDLYRK